MYKQTYIQADTIFLFLYIGNRLFCHLNSAGVINNCFQNITITNGCLITDNQSTSDDGKKVLSRNVVIIIKFVSVEYFEILHEYCHFLITGMNNQRSKPSGVEYKRLEKHILYCFNFPGKLSDYYTVLYILTFLKKELLCI